MSIVLKNGQVYYQGKMKALDVLVDDHGILTVADEIDLEDEVDEVLDASEMLIVPGLIDSHVDLTEELLMHKELLQAETTSMASGGYTTVFTMSNSNSVENLQNQLANIEKSACIHVYPYASIAKEQNEIKELNDFDALSEYVLGFSNHGKDIKEEIMRQAMLQAKKNNCIIVAHYENEWKQLEKDLTLAKETGCQYHACTLSCKESVELIRQAKKEGVDVSAEVSVYHLLLNEESISEENKELELIPPLPSKEDQQALLEGVLDGTIDMICTNPTSCRQDAEENLNENGRGIIKSELAFGLIYQYLVMTRKLSLEKVLECMSYNCANLFGIEGGEIINFEKANLAVFDLKARKRIDAKTLSSKEKNNPFIGWYMSGLCRMTIVDGKIVYRDKI